MHPPYVAVVGPGEGSTGTQRSHALEVGRLLGEDGYVVVTGGLSGVMAAAAAGTDRVGGTAVALLPGKDRASASPGHAIVIPTGMGEMRNALLVRCVDAVLAIGGSWGTLSEIALAVRTGVPVVALGGWQLPEPGVVACATPTEAMQAIRAAVRTQYGSSPHTA